jgi:hypothetical protein
MAQMGDVVGQGIKALEVADQAVDFPHTNAIGGMTDLTVQVGPLDDVSVDKSDGANTRTGDVLRCWAT